MDRLIKAEKTGGHRWMNEGFVGKARRERKKDGQRLRGRERNQKKRRGRRRAKEEPRRLTEDEGKKRRIKVRKNEDKKTAV